MRFIMRHHVSRFKGGLFQCAGSLILLSSMACTTTPGAIAPTSLPIPGRYVELSKLEAASSCGYTLGTVPLKNPKPVSEVIDELIKSRGGEALVDVTSNSTVMFYGIGVENCVNVKAKVINIAR
jgi:hypothetical protein